MSWINYNALWKIVLYGIVLGAGLPSLFAVGLVALSKGGKVQTAGGESDSDTLVGGNPLGILVAAICFLWVRLIVDRVADAKGDPRTFVRLDRADVELTGFDVMVRAMDGH